MQIIKYYPKKEAADIEWQGEIRKISLECALKNGIDIFKEFPDEKVPLLLSESEEIFCLEYLYSQLDKYFKTKSMYYRKLREKGFSKVSAQKAVDTAEKNGFINDRYFAQRYVETYSSKKGRFALKRDLAAKGVSAEIIDEILADAPTDSDELYILAKKLFKGEKNPKEKAALYRKLIARGFTYEEVNSVVKRIFEENFV